MFAVVDIAGFQETVAEGDKINVPLLSEEVGTSVTFDRVLLLADGEEITLGFPYVTGASVSAKVLGVGKGEKIRVQKAHRRKRYRRVKGHRQDYTEIEITKIAVQ